MTRKLGTVIEGANGKKFILIETEECPYCYASGKTIDLPEDHRNTPVGFIAYLDQTGTLRFVEEDPHDYR